MADLNEVGSDYEELVKQAMGCGLQGLDCTLVQLPSDQNGHYAVVLAAVTTERGVFRAVGEAWRDLLPAARRGDTLTTAEVRAKSRALREALGMPASSAPQVSTPLAAVGNGKPIGQPAPVPDRAIGTGAENAGAGERPTIGVTASASAAAGSSGAVSAPVGEPELRTNVAPRGGPLAKSPTTAEPTGEPAEERGGADAAAPARPSQMIVDGLSKDMINKLLEMTKRKAAMEGNAAGDEEALQRLDSYFQRAFGHPLAEASRMEGQRVIQRLAADLSRTGGGQGRAVTG